MADADSAPAGSVLASMGAMQGSLVKLIGQVRIAADSIATGSSQIASGNQDLSSRTEQQAAVFAGHAGETMAEVTQAVARVTDIMGEIAAASKSLEHQGQQLNESVAFFRIDGSESRRASASRSLAAVSAVRRTPGRASKPAVGEKAPTPTPVRASASAPRRASAGPAAVAESDAVLAPVAATSAAESLDWQKF